MDSVDDFTWVKKVNARWLVGETLRENAAAYIAYLAETDPERLGQSCRRARLLTQKYGDEEDPKPWFYAGLFSLAAVPEGERFLAGHDFTLASVPALDGVASRFLHPADLAELAEETREKIDRIRSALEGSD